MEKIIFQTKTTPQDYKKSVFFNMFLKKRTMAVITPLGAVIAIAAIIGKSTGKIEMTNWFYYVCLALLALIVLQYVVFDNMVKKFLKSDTLMINNERTVTITESGIREEGGLEKSTGEYTWDMFYHVFETKEYFYLYINTMQAIILPKRDFKGEEASEFGKLLKEKFEKRYQKR